MLTMNLALFKEVIDMRQKCVLFWATPGGSSGSKWQNIGFEILKIEIEV